MSTLLPNEEYEGFLAGVTEVLEAQDDTWRDQLGDVCARWRHDGYATAVLERALTLTVRPDVTGLLTTFTAAVAHLRSLEAQAGALDPMLLGRPAFRNPEAIPEAQRLVDGAMRSAARATPVVRSAVGAVDTFFLDAEKVVWEWPDFGGRVIEELR